MNLPPFGIRLPNSPHKVAKRVQRPAKVHVIPTPLNVSSPLENKPHRQGKDLPIIHRHTNPLLPTSLRNLVIPAPVSIPLPNPPKKASHGKNSPQTRQIQHIPLPQHHPHRPRQLRPPRPPLPRPIRIPHRRKRHLPILPFPIQNQLQPLRAAPIRPPLQPRLIHARLTRRRQEDKGFPSADLDVDVFVGVAVQGGRGAGVADPEVCGVREGGGGGGGEGDVGEGDGGGDGGGEEGVFVGEVVVFWLGLGG